MIIVKIKKYKPQIIQNSLYGRNGLGADVTFGQAVRRWKGKWEEGKC